MWTLVGMVRDVLRGHVGLDVLAVVAMVATLAVGEYIASLIIVLMLSGGEALEDVAGRRAKRELTALLDRTPRVAHVIVAPPVARMRTKSRMPTSTTSWSATSSSSVRRRSCRWTARC